MPSGKVSNVIGNGKCSLAQSMEERAFRPASPASMKRALALVAMPEALMNNRLCPVSPQLCTGKRRRNNRAAQLTGHCKRGGTRSLAANQNGWDRGGLKRSERQKQSESGFEYTPNAVEARREGLLQSRAGASRSVPAERLKIFRWKSNRAQSPPGQRPLQRKEKKNREIEKQE